MKCHLSNFYLTLLFLIILSNAVFVHGMQHENIPEGLKKIISVRFEKARFDDVLKDIAKKTGVKFNFSDNNIPINKKIKCDFRSQSAHEILKKLCEMTSTDLTITADSQVIITKQKNRLQLRGRVTDKESGSPLIGVNVIVKGLPYGAATDEDGYYEIENLERREYTLVYNFIGYKTHAESGLDLGTMDEITRNVELETESISLAEITVTPGVFSFLKSKSIAQQTLSKEEIENMSFGEDVYRAITRIPGLASNDFSSTFRMRGGERDEILVTLDGMRLIEPFHIKDINNGALSIVDAAVIGGADVLTGGFSAEYGDKMSGVFKMESIAPSIDKSTLSASISMMNARLMTKGSFADGQGNYIFSARRGYLDFILNLLKDENIPKPTYYDIYMKVGYSLDDKHKLSVNMLYAADKFYMDEDEDDYDTTRTNYSNNSVWLNLNSVWNKNLFSRSMIYFNHYKQGRRGIGYEENGTEFEFLVDDQRNYDMIGFKQDWQFDMNEDVILKFGFDFCRTLADYKYNNTYVIWGLNNNSEFYDSTFARNVNISPSGNKFGSYMSVKVGLTKKLFGELGLRYDANSYAGDKLFSPRINLSYNITDKTFLRVGYGYFYQSQDIQSIRIENGESVFHNAELAKHYVAGIEHLFENGVSVRLEAYLKQLSNLQPSYRNYENEIEMFPEVMADNITVEFDKTESKGVELFLKYDKGGLLSFWGSYCYSFVDDYVKTIRDSRHNEHLINNKIPGQFDQRHTVNFDLNFRPGNNWHINLAWQYRTGYPYTDKKIISAVNSGGQPVYVIVNEDYLGSQYPDYHRLDMRISKYFDTDYGVFNVFFECLNLYGHDNIRCYGWKANWNDDLPELRKKDRTWFPFIPSVGIRWDFDY